MASRSLVLIIAAFAAACGGQGLDGNPTAVKPNAPAGDASISDAPEFDLSGPVVDGGVITYDGSAPPVSESLSTACDHLFAATYQRCNPVWPSSEVTRILPRFEAVCANQAKLPGSGVNAATLEACAAALDQSECTSPYGPPIECSFRGTLTAGAPCADGLQCDSGQCWGASGGCNPGGTCTPLSCGTCLPQVPVGASCGNPALCVAGAVCLSSDPNTYQDNCYALAFGGVGAACDGLSQLCDLGLYCSSSWRCQPLVASAGQACGEGSYGGGCAVPLTCNDESRVCESGNAAGASCGDDWDCALSLGCGDWPDCINGPCTSTCEPLTWAGSGEPCGGYTRCLVGYCDGTTCQTVIPEGQPCQGVGFDATCDTFAECFKGTCVLIDGVTCN